MAVTPATPGPWHYRPTTIGYPDNRINPIITTDFDGIKQAHYVARVGWAGSTIQGMTSLAPATFEEAEANARLIAAAPKLLEALEAFQHYPCQGDDCKTYPAGLCPGCHARAAIAEAKGEQT